jgi:hypothetical protein
LQDNIIEFRKPEMEHWSLHIRYLIVTAAAIDGANNPTLVQIGDYRMALPFKSEAAFISLKRAVALRKPRHRACKHMITMPERRLCRQHLTDAQMTSCRTPTQSSPTGHHPKRPGS